MMSLFNSFDLMISMNTMMMYIMIMFMMLNKITKTCVPYFVGWEINNYFLKFLFSLKPKMVSKMFQMKVISVFIMILIMNFLSVKPFYFPYTSQIKMVMLFSVAFWGSFIMISLKKNFKGFMSHTIPEGTPMVLVWFLFVIEIISNLIRPITLTVRLVANITAGHLLMILLSNLVFTNNLTMIFYFMLNSVELAVAIIQSYIMITMITLYYSEVN